MTKYPTVALPPAMRFLQARSVDPQIGISDLPCSLVGNGAPFDQGRYVRLAQEVEAIRAAITIQKPQDQTRFEEVEARAAKPVHLLLAGHPAEVLSDMGFWRYLALGPFWDLSLWRARSAREDSTPAHSGDSSTPKPAAAMPHVFACARHSPIDCFPWRLFMRAEIAGISEDIGDADELMGVLGVDLWWSHIFRVQIGRSHPTAQAILRLYREKHPSTEVTREWAKRVTQLRATIVFELLSSEEIMGHIRAELEAAQEAIRPNK